MPLSDYVVCEGIIFWYLYISWKCLTDILAINYLFVSCFEQLIVSIKNSGSFHHAHRSCDKLLVLNWIKLNSWNQFSDSSIHKYDFKICFPWILKLDIHCFCRQSPQLTYPLEYLWKAYTKRVWTASKSIHLNTKMNICSPQSFYCILWGVCPTLPSIIFLQITWTKVCSMSEKDSCPTLEWKEDNIGKQVPGKKEGSALKMLAWQVRKNKQTKKKKKPNAASCSLTDMISHNFFLSFHLKVTLLTLPFLEYIF